MNKKIRAEILVNGIVQGVGFRYFVYRNALELDLKGYTKNLYSGEVFTVVEGDVFKVEEMIKLINNGPSHARVSNIEVSRTDIKNEFDKFEIRG